MPTLSVLLGLSFIIVIMIIIYSNIAGNSNRCIKLIK